MKSNYLINFVIFLVIFGVAVLIYQYWYLASQSQKELASQIGDSLVIEELSTTTSNNMNTTNNNSQTIVDGLSYQILKEGTGQAAQNGDTVEVDYVGTLTNGAKFDSSIDRGEPFSFTLGEGRVIRGWDLGVLGMKIGEKRKLTIAPELGYGARAIGSIPPNSTLVFEVELLKIN